MSKSLELSLGFDQTRNLFSADSRVTVEVLDDAAQDATPRDDMDIEKEKKQAQEAMLHAIKMKDLQSSELKYRTSQFEDEKKRLHSEKDTFVPAPTVTIHDVTIEKNRLDKLEESARIKKKNYILEADYQKSFLQKGTSSVGDFYLLRR